MGENNGAYEESRTIAPPDNRETGRYDNFATLVNHDNRLRSSLILLSGIASP